MQFEIAQPTCPLCKRQVRTNSPEQTLSTRLCDQCQNMVLKALRGSDSMRATSGAFVPQVVRSPIVQYDAPALDHSTPVSSAIFEGLIPAESGFEEAQIPFQSTEEMMFTFYDNSVSVGSIDAVKANGSAFSKNGSSLHREELSEAFEYSSATRDHDYPEADTHLTAPDSTFAGVDSADTGTDLVEHRSEDLPSFEEQAITNPLETPLHSWDYSQSEWPVLVGPSQPRSIKKLRFAIAAVVLLGTAAGFYFLIYRPSNPVQRAATDLGTTARVSAGEPRPDSVGSADSRAQAQPASTPVDAPEKTASTPAETGGREAGAANGESAQGRFSLQAAAFTTQGGAEEFAEKLKRSGLPSYVVSTDLARRGRWFRVRVGRFNSAEDAQRFAGEAQQRARAGGHAVQLIVCQYDQP
jgi:cell division septation protein DedD